MMTEEKEQFLWVEQYRPKTVEDCILPPRIKNSFIEFRDADNFPNLMLSGTAGTGKTSIALALCRDLDRDVLFLNASSDRNLATIKNTITSFCGTQSAFGQKKVVILDEADGLDHLAQPALKGVFEEFPHVRFILTCNNKNKLIPPIHSRTTLVEFNIRKEERKQMMLDFIQRVFQILKAENIKYDQEVVVKLVKANYPDNRKILNNLQRYSVGGEIDSGILDIGGDNVADLLTAIKTKDFGAARKWVATNSDIDTHILFRAIYEAAYDQIAPESVPVLVLMLAQYQFWATHVADQEINTMAFVADMMQQGIEFK